MLCLIFGLYFRLIPEKSLIVFNRENVFLLLSQGFDQAELPVYFWCITTKIILFSSWYCTAACIQVVGVTVSRLLHRLSRSYSITQTGECLSPHNRSVTCNDRCSFASTLGHMTSLSPVWAVFELVDELVKVDEMCSKTPFLSRYHFLRTLRTKPDV